MSGRGYGDRWWEENNTIPADLEKTNTAAAASAASTFRDSYTVKIPLDIVKGKIYKFLFQYQHQNPDTKEIKLSDTSPVWTEPFAIENLTKAVQNLTLTAGSQSYGVKFDLDPTSVQEDVVIFESLTSNFATQTIVYTGTSTNVSILTTGANAFAPRWIKVRSRDKWEDLNISEVTAGPVSPFSADVDTTYTVANPATTSASAVLDPKDLSGFSLASTMTWPISTDTKTAGYAIRWSTDNPSTVTTPLWEYASVSGRATTSFTATGLIPNTTYYYQVASSTPYNVVTWTGAASGTFIASDSDGTAAGALARLRSFIAIGGATQDLFKIGTGISQSINLTITPQPTPTLTPGTYHGIILNKSTTNVGNNFWLTTGQFRVGNPTEFMYWSGTNLYLTGNVNATGGLFTGNVQLAIPAGATSSGTLFAGSNAESGARVRFSSEGIFAYSSASTSNSTGKTFSLEQATGRIDATLGTVGGWTLATSGFSSGGASILNTGNISLGNNPQANLDSIVRLSADDLTYRLWIGSQTGSNAPFRVTKEGKLYATGAVIDGTTTIGGTVASTVVSNATTGSTALQPDGTLTGDVTGKVNGVAVATVTSGAAKGAAAIQEGNGIGIDSTLKYINTIDLNSSGIVIKTAASGTRMQLTNAGLELFNGTTRTVFIDAATGTAKFAGDISGSVGSFTGGLKTGTSGARIEIPSASGSVNFYTTDPAMTDPASISTLSVNLSGANLNWLRLESPTKSGNGLSVFSLSSDTSNRSYIYSSASEFTHLGGTFKVPDGVSTLYAVNTSFIDMAGASKYIQLSTASTIRTLFSTNGTIYANYLNTSTDGQGNSTGGNTGTSIVQNSTGYLKVSGSSRRFKEDITPISQAGYLDAMLKIEPVNFRYINPDYEEPLIAGLIAEDLDLIPEFKGVVNYDNNGLPVSIGYDRMSALLVLAIKELNDKLDNITSRLDALEA